MRLSNLFMAKLELHEVIQARASIHGNCGSVE